MPTIEFHGYSEEERRRLLEQFRARLSDLSFKQAIVFVTASTQVEGFDGGERPFVRLLGRDAQRSQAILLKLGDLADIEWVKIDFFERRSS